MSNDMQSADVTTFNRRMSQLSSFGAERSRRRIRSRIPEKRSGGAEASCCGRSGHIRQHRFPGRSRLSAPIPTLCRPCGLRVPNEGVLPGGGRRSPEHEIANLVVSDWCARLLRRHQAAPARCSSRFPLQAAHRYLPSLSQRFQQPFPPFFRSLAVMWLRDRLTFRGGVEFAHAESAVGTISAVAPNQRNRLRRSSG